MRIGFMDESNKGTFKIDISNLSGKKLLEHVILAAAKLEDINDTTNFFVDVRGCRLNVESLGYLKIAGKRVQQHVNKSAIIGVNNNIKPFFNLYIKYTKSPIKSFEDEHAAQEYINS